MVRQGRFCTSSAFYCDGKMMADDFMGYCFFMSSFVAEIELSEKIAQLFNVFFVKKMKSFLLIFSFQFDIL